VVLSDQGIKSQIDSYQEPGAEERNEAKKSNTGFLAARAAGFHDVLGTRFTWLDQLLNIV
jgi:hypothetical protein